MERDDDGGTFPWTCPGCGASGKEGPYPDSDHYGFILGRNARGRYVTWHFHLLDDESVSVYWGHYFMENRDAAVRDFDTRDKG